MISLADRKWKVFSLTGEDGLFPIHATSTGVDGVKLKDGENAVLPYITRTETNNGIAKFISSVNLEYGKDDGGCITIGLDTQTAYWQPVDFVTGQNIHVLRSNKLNYYSYQFLTVILRQQMKSKFNWGGNGATLGRLKKLKIMLPVTDDGEPDYQFMEDFMRERIMAKKTQYRQYLLKRLPELGTVPDDQKVDWSAMIDSHEWEPFYMSQIFDEPQRGKRIVNENHIVGDTPLVSSQGNNNGVTNFVGNKDGVRRFKNCLSIANGGSSAGKCYYQPFEFIGADHVTQCFRLDANPEQYLFLSTIVSKALMGKYGFSHEIKDKALVRERVLLPVTVSGQPDYEFMESFGRKMMSNKYNQYLAYLAMSDTVS